MTTFLLPIICLLYLRAFSWQATDLTVTSASPLALPRSSCPSSTLNTSDPNKRLLICSGVTVQGRDSILTRNSPDTSFSWLVTALLTLTFLLPMLSPFLVSTVSTSSSLSTQTLASPLGFLYSLRTINTLMMLTPGKKDLISASVADQGRLYRSMAMC